MDLPLPVDIFLNIFSRLPIKSLLRCRCVSKTWQILSLDPHLPKMHLNFHHHHKKPNFILYSSHSADSNQSLLNNSNNTHLYFLESFNLHNPIRLKSFPLDSWLSRFTIAGSCNGLLCLIEFSSSHSHSQDAFILNPSSGDYIHLPPTLFSGHFLSFGFGFNTISEDYKVVRIKSGFPFFSSFGSSIINVYTLGDSQWRKVGCVDYHIDYRSPSVLLNNRLHWKCYAYQIVDQNQEPLCLASVACFNLATEALDLIPFPDFINELDLVNKVSLVSLGESLSFYRTTYQIFSWYRITIWVMKDYGVKDSWQKQFIIRDSLVFNPNIKFAKPLCLNDDGEILLICGGKQLVAYHPEAKTYRELGFYNSLDPVMAVAHVGSLIPLTFGNERVNQLQWTRGTC